MTRGPMIAQGRTAELFAWGDGQVLKLFRQDFPVESVRYEADVASMAYEAGLTVPAVGDIVHLDGRTGILYERIEGPSLRKTIEARPWALLWAVDRFVSLQVAMHERACPQLPSQRERMVDKIQNAPHLAAETKAQILQVLSHLPDGHVVCHGDYHPDNLLVSSRGLIVIDWMDATHGNPLADVARTLLLLRHGDLPPDTSALGRRVIGFVRGAFTAAYLRRYCRLRSVSQEQIDAWMLPVTAARLSEQIPGEGDRLVAMVRTALT